MEIIATHLNAEFDSFASMVAAHRLYPEALLVFPGAQERNLRLFLESFPHHYRFRRLRSIRLEEVTRLILVDTRRLDRIGRLSAAAERPEVEVHVYDHHPASSHDVRATEEHLADTGAATTLMVEIFRQRQMRITPVEATILGLGIYEDTGSLTFPSTTPRDLQAAAYLLECGMDLRVVAEHVSRELTAEQVSLLNDLLAARTFVEVRGIRMAVAAAARERFVGDLAVLAHKMKEIENLNVLFLLVRLGDRVHLVARSRLEAVDVGKIAAALGGGGHATAGSAVIRERDPDVARRMLLEAIDREVRPLATARDLMTAPLKSVEPGVPLAEARDVMVRFGIDHLPVVAGGLLAGILHRDTADRAVRHGLEGQPLVELMDTGYGKLAPGDGLWRIQELFLDRGQHFLPVVEEGRLLGAVTTADLLGVLREGSYRHPAPRVGEGVERQFHPARNVAELLAGRLPPAVAALVRRLGETGREMGLGVYLVGGFVRDLLLDAPNLDLDLVVEGDAIGYARRLAETLGGRVRSHNRFETAVVVLPDGFKLDVATARMEYYEHPGALPIIEHGSIRMDLFRRDFSINALAVQISGGEHGRLVDFFGGQGDLEEGMVRVLHDLSFVDDPTRLYRAVRFEQRLNFVIAEHTLRLMAQAVAGHLVASVTGMRLAAELRGLLLERHPLPGLRRLGELGLLAAIHPALAADTLDESLFARLDGVLAEKPFHVIGPPRRWLVYLAALCRRAGLEELNDLATRLSLARRPAALLSSVALGHQRLAAALDRPGLPPSGVRRAVVGVPLETLAFTLAHVAGTPVEEVLRSYLAREEEPPSPLAGEDLEAMGYRPGPLFRRILDDLLDWRLDGEITDAESARRRVRERYPRETEK